MRGDPLPVALSDRSTPALHDDNRAIRSRPFRSPQSTQSQLNLCFRTNST
jgi:hypothetical protein